MASQKNIKPGTFESVVDEAIGTFVLDQFQQIKLDGFLPFVVEGSTAIVKSGGVPLAGSAFEFATDTNLTTQESGQTGATLSGAIRITDNSFVGIPLTLSGKNYGSYGSNEGFEALVNSLLAGKVAPGSDLFIKDREPVEFDGITGKFIESANSGEVALWDAGPVFGVAGTLRRLEGITASATGALLNQNKNPLLLTSAPFWYLPKDEKELIRCANQGIVCEGEMSVIHDRAATEYQQNLLIGKRALGGVIQNISLIHLDGSIVTGNTTLENLFGIGGDLNPYIDIFAPDVVGTRTLLDMGGHVVETQSISGSVDTLGEIHDDVMQRITGHFEEERLMAPVITSTASGALKQGVSASRPGAASAANQTNQAIDFDNSLSISPNAAKTDDDRTAHAALVAGASYIVVIQSA